MKTTPIEEETNIREAWDRFQKSVLDRLIQQTKAGHRGWDGAFPMTSLLNGLKDDVSSIKIHRVLTHAEAKEDSKACVDIAARAMFLWFRNQHHPTT